MTHIVTITSASALCSSRRCKRTGSEEGNNFVCRVIKPGRCRLCLPSPPFTDSSLRCLGGKQLYCFRCKTQMCFMACDNRFPPHHASLRHFNSSNIHLSPSVYSACSPPWAVMSCTTISRFLIDLFKMLDTTGFTQLSHIKFPEPRVQLGSLQTASLYHR